MNGPQHIPEQELQTLHDEAFRWAMSCCNYEEEKAREVMQTVYLEILDKRAVFNGRSSLRTWLYAVIRQVSWRHTRKAISVARLKARFKTLAVPGPDCSDPVEATADIKTGNLVLEALAGLPPVQRQLVELLYYRGMTLSEAARILDISTGSASTHLHRAKQMLKKKLAHIQA